MPSVMGTGAPAVRFPVLTVVRAPQRESGQAAPGPVSAFGPWGVPATKRLPPLSNPLVAPPGTGTTALNVAGTAGEAKTPLKSTETTLASFGMFAPWVLPHSPAQFRMKAWVSLAPKTAVMGWSSWGPVTEATVLLTVSITKKVLVIWVWGSLKASSLVPLGLMTRRRAVGT